MNANHGPVYLLLAAGLCLAPLALAQEQAPQEQAPQDQPAKPESQPEPKPAAPSTPSPAPASPAPQAPASKAAAPQPASEAPEPEGRQLFQVAADTIRHARSINYRVKTFAEGQMLSTYTSKSQADVRMLRFNTGWLVRSTGSGSSMSLKEGTEFDVAWLGAHNEWVDHTAKKVFEKMARDTKGPAVTLAPPTKLDEFLEPSPYSAAIGATDYIVEPQREKDGVMCDVVLAIAGRSKTRWMLGADDHLPRWRERIIEGNAAAGSMISEITSISVDTNDPPRLTPEMLRVTVPEGYAEDRVPPPPPPPPPGEMPQKTLAPAPSQPDKPDAPARAPVPAPKPTVQRAPEFDLKDAGGKSVTLASLRGSPVLFEFAGTWALALRDAHPELDQFTKDYKHLGVKVYMLDVREKSSANAVNDLKPFSFDLLLDADQVAKLYAVRKYPTYVLIDKDGNIVHTEAGYKKSETINALRDSANQIAGDRVSQQPQSKPEDKAAPPAPASTALGAPNPAEPKK